MKPNEVKNIESSKFEFVQRDERIFDTKFETKPISYLKDALLRFQKNKGSVVATCIIILLVLYAIIVPIFSPYDAKFKDLFYQKVLPRTEFGEVLGFWDGTEKRTVNETEFLFLQSMGIENQNEYQPIRSYTERIEETVMPSGTVKTKKMYDIVVDTYYEVGYEYVNLTKKEYNALVEYQNTTGIQVLYPMIDLNEKQFKTIAQGGLGLTTAEANYWYLAKDQKALASIDKDGNYTDVYYLNSDYESLKNNPDYANYEYSYTSKRIAGDPGLENPNADNAYAYFIPNQSGYRVRVLYYEYFTYKNGTNPSFIFGVNGEGQDIFVCLAIGARLSFLLAVCVSVINLILGAIYGAIEGYYGGAVDMFMERISDILSGVPFIVVATLFQIHLATKVGVIPSLLFAFVMTGWIGTASRVRSQFYRFKGQEYVLAARTLGAKDSRLIIKHIFPNSLGTLITSSVLVIPGVIFSESSLSFLGIIDFTTSNLTSVGTLLSQGNSAFPNHPHIVLFPALFIALLMISFNLFGNGLRDAFNPSLRGADE